MKIFVNSLLFYFLFPMYLALVLVLVFYHIPGDFYVSLTLLYSIITPIVLFARVMLPLNFRIDCSYFLILKEKRHRVAIFLFSCVVLLSGPLDIYVNGFRLFDPANYAVFNGMGRYVRHISILCWTLVPIAFVFVENTKLRIALISYAIIFPILIIDRNRLLASFYSLVMCFLLMPPPADVIKSKKCSKTIKVFLLLVLVFFIFAGIGFFRSGSSSFLIKSSGDSLSEGFLPLKENFYYLPLVCQQIVLYITTPIFNFITVAYFDFRNEAFLQSQLSPFSRDLFQAYPYAPVMVPRFNVGTEFYPWFLYGGFPFVCISFFFVVLFFLFTVFCLKRYPNIFTFLLFLKISYLVLFIGFAPQFYLLLNFAFVLMIIILWFGSLLLLRNPALE